MREPATEELRWWRRFKKCLKEMPPNVEVIVSAYGSCELTEAGSERDSFSKRGDLDNIPTFSIPAFVQKRLITNESSI